MGRKKPGEFASGDAGLQGRPLGLARHCMGSRPNPFPEPSGSQAPARPTSPGPQPPAVPSLALSDGSWPAAGPRLQASPASSPFRFQGLDLGASNWGIRRPASRLPLPTRFQPCLPALRTRPRGRETFVPRLRSAPPLGAAAHRKVVGRSPAATCPSTPLRERFTAPGYVGGPRRLDAFSGWPWQAPSEKGPSRPQGAERSAGPPNAGPFPRALCPNPIAVWAERSREWAGTHPANSLPAPHGFRAATLASPGLASGRVRSRP